MLSDLWTQPPSLMTPLPRVPDEKLVDPSLCFKGLFDRGRRLVRVLDVRLINNDRLQVLQVFTLRPFPCERAPPQGYEGSRALASIHYP